MKIQQLRQHRELNLTFGVGFLASLPPDLLQLKDADLNSYRNNHLQDCIDQLAN